MNKSIFLVLLLPLTISSQVTLDWQQFTRGDAIATDAFDNVFTIDWEYAPAGDIILTKRDATGNFIWSASFDNTDDTRHEVATWVETDHENNIIVTGTIRSGYASPVNAASVVMKFDTDGNLLWRNVFESSFDGSYTKKCLVDASNNIYVLGMGTGATGFVVKVKKFKPDGTALWSYFNEDGIGAPLNFKFTPDNRILIIGRGIIGSVNGYAKINLAGNEIWSYPGVLSLTTGDAAGDNSGNTYLINGEYVFGIAGSIITKLTPSGTFIWDELNDMAGLRVEVGSDQNPVISGYPNSGTFGAAFMKYDTAGNVIWNNPDADGAGYNLLLHSMMKLDASNNAYLSAGTLTEMAVCKINADGSSGWVAHCSGSYANGFVFGNDFSIYVAGGTTAHFIQDAALVCGAPSGLFTNNISTTKAKLNWTVVPGSYQYEVWYKKATAAGWKKKFVPGINNKLNLKNLLCNTNYVWKIRTICDTAGIDLISDFSPDQFFTTFACREENNLMGDDEQIAFGIYPNPADDQFTILIPEADEAAIKIIDLNGRTIYQSKTQSGATRVTISTTDWTAGIYTIIISTTKTLYSEKLMIVK